MDEASFLRAQQSLTTLDDPLAPFLEHWQYQLAHSAMAAPKMLTFLEQATRQFIDDPRYRNDPRYLKLWLEYAKRCREPEDVFLFLELKQVATGLASYYEEYAAYLERRQLTIDPQQCLSRIDGIFCLGLSRQARPIERLQVSHQDFINRHAGSAKPAAIQLTSTTSAALGRHSWSQPVETAPPAWTGRSQRQEIPSYDPALINGGMLTFEEVRAADYRRKLKATSAAFSAQAMPVSATSHSIPIQAIQTQAWSASRQPQMPAHAMQSQPVVQPHPQQMRAMISLTDEEEDDGLEGVPSAVMVNPEDLTHVSVYHDNTADLRELSAQLAKPVTTAQRPEAADRENQAKLPTSPSLLPDPFAAAELRASLIEAQTAAYNPAKLQRVSDSALGRLRSLDRIIGRDGSGPNQTVSALRLPGTGHFFIEGRLAPCVYVAVDLELDAATAGEGEEGGSSSAPLALKAVSPPCLWEPLLLDRIHAQLERLAAVLPATCLASLQASFPHVQRLCLFNDVLFQLQTLYPLGSLARLLQKGRLEETVALFFARELIRLLMVLIRVGLAHGRITADHLLVRTAEVVEWSSRFQADGSGGWGARGLTLCGFSRAVDLTALPQASLQCAHFLADWRACHALISGWRGRLPIWQVMTETLTSASIQSLGQGAAALEMLLGRVEPVLEEEASPAPGRPSLKAQLTRLEIELLEK